MHDVTDLARLVAMFEANRPQLLRTLTWRLDPVLASRLDPEELLHEVFLRASRAWPRFEASGLSGRAWLYRLTLDVLIDALRHEYGRRGRHRGALPWPEGSSAPFGWDLAASLTSPSQVAAREELQQRVRAAVDRLDPRDREVLVLRHFEDLSFRDVAGILAITPDAAMKRYARAIARLKDLWLGADGPPSGG